MKKSAIIISLFILNICHTVSGQNSEPATIVGIARIKYQGGGDWYNDPSALPNLAKFMKKNTRVNISDQQISISLTDEKLFSCPIIFITGHGNLKFNQIEIDRLREYLLKGGFLYVDDDYGLDRSFRTVIRQVFPTRSLQELPFSHKIYSIHYKFPAGLPKIHEHDKKPPRGLGIFDDQGRLMVFYTWETNLSDGWADVHVHNDPPEKRRQALQMGTNIIIWALSN